MAVVLKAVDREGIETGHTHSIVLYKSDEYAQFDMKELIDTLQANKTTQYLAADFFKKYMPWVNKDAATMVRKVNAMLGRLEKHAFLNVQKKPGIALRV